MIAVLGGKVLYHTWLGNAEIAIDILRRRSGSSDVDEQQLTRLTN